MHTTNKKLHRTVFLWAGLCICFRSIICGYTLKPISGDISTITFDSAQKFYQVVADIEVPTGKSVQIPEGIVFLFNPDLTFRINGSCEINGTALSPVFLTSINDTVNPNSSGIIASQWDWKGIIIGKTASNIVFRNVHLNYADAPFEADSASKNIILDMVIRFRTGQTSFRLPGKRLEVKSNEPFSYPAAESSTGFLISTTADTSTFSSAGISTHSGVTEYITPSEDMLWWKQSRMRWTLGGTGLAALLASGGCIVGYYVFNEDYNNKKDIYYDQRNLNYEERRAAKKSAVTPFNRRNNCKTSGIVSGIAAAVFTTGLVLTYCF